MAYLGHVISDEGVSADPQKVAAMVKWPEPKNVMELRGFLGLTGYYRRFVKDYGKIPRPLTDLLKKKGFVWSEKATEAFQALKEAVTQLAVLMLPDFRQPFTIETDVSGAEIGAVLSQGKRPIAYISQGFSEKGKAKSVYERELLAIVFAVTKWKHHFAGQKVIIKTDQKSLKHLLDQRAISGDQHKWAYKLLGLDYNIWYKPGVENKVADALSRMLGEQVCMLQMTAPKCVYLVELAEQVEQDPLYKKIIQRYKAGILTDTGYEMRDGRFYMEGRLVILAASKITRELMEQFHSSLVGGHEGVLKTFKRMSREVYWKGMKKDITKFIKECQVCQTNKYSTLSPAGLLSP